MSESIVPPSIVPEPTVDLATGWEPEAPLEDTLVRRAVHAEAAWAVQVARATGRPWRRTDDWTGGWVGDRGELTNPVVLLRPPRDAAGLVSEIARLMPPQVPYLLLSAWQATDLSPHGLVLVGHPPLMVRFPAPAPDTARAGVEVREVTDASSLAVAERVLLEGYPFPGMYPGDLFSPAVLEAGVRIWLATVDGEPAAVSAGYTHAGLTVVEYVAALANARGRGAGAAVTWAATTAVPDHPAVLLASDDGRPLYERMGYVAIERWSAWLRPAST